MIVFIVRKFNDVDHVAPIVYKLAKEGAGPLRVLSMGPGMSISEDYRLRFLAEQYDVPIDYVYTARAPSIVHRLAADLMCGPKLSGLGFRRLARSLYSRLLHRRVYHRLFDERWASGLLAALNPRVLVFDWVKSQQLVAGALVEAARALGIPTIAVPHGVHLIRDDLFTNARQKSGRPPDLGRAFNMFDHVVVQSPFYRDMVTRNGVLPQKVRILGSARYCDEWRTVHLSLSGEGQVLPGLDETGKLKIVFMDYPAGYRINMEQVSDTLRRLSRLDFVELLIKPATRSNRLSMEGLGSMARVVSETPSVDLVAWADVVMGTTSSILLEAHLQRKVLLYPKYFHGNTMLFEEMNACWTVNSYQELEGALRRLFDDPLHTPYSEEDVERLMTEVVYGGVRGRDVLAEYAEFITSVGERTLPQVVGGLDS